MATTLDKTHRSNDLTGLAGSAARRGGKLTLEATRILAGRSEITPDGRDWRFQDETWQTHPAYRRLMQLYLAWADTLGELVAEADLDWRDRYRAEFVVELLTAAAAPTNTLVGNPAALKRAWETAGLSILRGTRHLVRDLARNRGMPSTVDRSGFVVGKNLAATPGAVVYRDEVCEVLQYAPTTPTVHERPVLLIPPQIGRFYFMDLAPGRSFVEYAVAQGIPFFLISWRNPTREHADWNFDTYALAVERVIDVVREISGSDDVNLLSLCAGGILTAGVLSHLAAQGDTRVRSASFGVTLLDFAEPALIGMFRAGPVIALARERSSRAGVLDAGTLSAVFSLLRPNELVFNYVVNNYLLGKSPARFDILAWNADGTNLPAELHRQFLDIYQHNLLAEPGGIDVLGTPVDLGRVELETYVTGATTDHLTPWKGCYRTTQLLSGPSTFVLSNAGHIASLVNPPGKPKAHYFAGPEPTGEPDEWLASAERESGTWWTHWATWVGERSGGERKAPGRLGSRRHPVLGDAPGTYVHG
jgi:polyhydroxyalkanoate synthase subunit PhaC